MIVNRVFFCQKVEIYFYFKEIITSLFKKIMFYIVTKTY